ncbi:helix-turn-helix domain-containing protein [Bradyrhizobium japonicum]|uniref:helix-turn-helix domain-containing protein n=1 Tax=Bradyrhizobium japonicum TaxID=375 RepID=UPI00200DB837|nr:helix-turn-helix transcriptional regulator [Bradyrhizobium japonicum]
MTGILMPVVTISGTQCAAARALLGWSQDDLARNAQVARATIASFEGNGRIEPMRKNLLAIIAALEAAGVAFIPEDVENGLGAGVSRRKLELQYSNTVRPVGWDVIFPVRYKGQPCSVTIPRAIIDDIDNSNDRTDEGRVKVVQNALPRFLIAVEQLLGNLGEVPSEITLDHGAFTRGTF